MTSSTENTKLIVHYGAVLDMDSGSSSGNEQGNGGDTDNHSVECPSCASDEAHEVRFQKQGQQGQQQQQQQRYDDNSPPLPHPNMLMSFADWELLSQQRRQERFNRLFSEVRSEDDFEKEAETNESDVYMKSTAWQRAMPERLFALTITLLLEIPVLLMVSGGSDSLCHLIGRKRYQLLIGFLPLTSAISGNVGLQASTLTTRAISHAHVTTKDYGTWLSTELASAFYLGGGMGCLLGSVAWLASTDLSFGITIAIAQLLSIVTAGLTGTLAPLLFSFIFHRDSGKWGGPLETAIQDIVGSFAMVIVSFHILKFLGPGSIDPHDSCGPS